MEFRGCVGWYEGSIWKGVTCSSISPKPGSLGKYVLDEMRENGLEEFVRNIKMVASFDDYINGERCKFCGLRGVGYVFDAHPALLDGEFISNDEYPDSDARYHTHFIDAGKHLTQYNSDPYHVAWVYIINQKHFNVDVYKSFKEDKGNSIDYGIGKYVKM